MFKTKFETLIKIEVNLSLGLKSDFWFEFKQASV